MKTMKTMVLSAGVVVLLGANYEQSRNAAPTAGGFGMFATSITPNWSGL